MSNPTTTPKPPLGGPPTAATHEAPSLAREVALETGCPEWTEASGCDFLHRHDKLNECFCLNAAKAVLKRARADLGGNLFGIQE